MPNERQRGAGGADGTLVVVAGRWECGDALQFRQGLLDVGPPVLQPFDGLHPAAGRLVQVPGQAAGAGLDRGRGWPRRAGLRQRPGRSPVKLPRKAIQVVVGAALGEGDEVPEEAAPG